MHDVVLVNKSYLHVRYHLQETENQIQYLCLTYRHFQVHDLTSS